MKFNEFGLLNFGKFEDKIIHLEDGLNIIYGENEGGKSTIVNFIDGIFYGFSKDSLKKKIKDDIYDKSKPWNSNLYKGYINLSDGKKDYRISRDFENDTLNILDIYKGEELTDSDKLYEYSRIPQPGALFFDINRKMYCSSFFLSQRLSQVEEDAANELKQRIDNFSVSSNENFNYNKVLEKMEEDLYKLGTNKRKTSDIGRLYSELDKINNESSSLVHIRDKYNEVLDELNKKNQRLNELKDNLRGRKLFELQNLKEKLKTLEDKNIKDELNYEDYDRAIELNKLIRFYLNKLDSLMIDNDDEFISDETDYEEDYINFRNINDRLNELNLDNFSKEMEIISSDLVNIKNNGNFYLLKIISSFLLSVLIIVLSIYFKNYFFIILSLIPLTYSYFRVLRYRENRDLQNRLKNKLVILKKKSVEKTLEKQKYDREFEILYNKYNVSNTTELSQILENNRLENVKRLSKKEFNKLVEDRNREELIDTKNKIKEFEDEIYYIFDKYGVNNISEFKNKFNDFKDASINEINNIKLQIKDLSREDLGGEIYQESDISDIENKIRNENLEISNLEGVLSALEDSLSKYRSLKEKSYELNRRLEKLEHNKEVLEFSISKLKSFMKSRREDSLPAIKNNIEKIISQITDSKYDEILIDDKFNIKIYDNDLNDYVDLSSLSIGTIDQIYLSFRLSISKIISDKNIPIILDSHFDSYDDNRLYNTLSILGENNQTIIFTSTKREIEILNKMNRNYNLINI
ncbi:AAA family ATPase [Peptoniphilus sp. MSJ-1]|uniref:AAA family ATPase n=1 Tax=Peptoniphilus ovalis TaxID=2841503 RepID=A0ABS6FGR0_9FIRM|nr:AAA family ATPase [Peptoniphilus ovalis]MBU5669344.1 AAA family ATPase [Peptoniphilus ovalis]